MENGSNHTPQFTEAARAPEAHEMTLTISKALAMTAFRVIQDDAFFQQVSGGDSNCCSALSRLCPGTSLWLICTRPSGARVFRTGDFSLST